MMKVVETQLHEQTVRANKLIMAAAHLAAKVQVVLDTSALYSGKYEVSMLHMNEMRRALTNWRDKIQDEIHER